jgi:GrpB-like predicted nucleotidyltransferase (UPF0157 family)
MLLQPYSSQWPIHFLEIKKVIEEAFQNQNFKIIHVGGTAVLGLASKPIIDIDIVYDKGNSFNVIKKSLEKVGYYHNGNQGIVSREVFKRHHKVLNNSVLDFIPHHLYVCQKDNIELKRHIEFRNYLIRNEGARLRYEKLKYEIAAQANQDHKAYAALKEIKAKAFIESCIANSENEN